ncbi:MAG: hemolysin D [Bacteroidia bacterium]|nr:MAG: hemolysin D [Bacteroidia bacterium]
MKRVILFLYSIIIIWSCKNDSQKPEQVIQENTSEIVKLTESQVLQLGIKVDSLQIKNFSTVIAVKGKLELPPQNLISLSVPLGGYIQKIYPIHGQEVKKGEVLMVLQDPAYAQLQQEYLSAKAKLDFLSKEYARQKSLKEAQATSTKNFEELQMNYESHKILIKSLEKKLELLGIDIQKLNENTLNNQIEIRSPINGYVSAIALNTGKYAQPTDILMELIDVSDIHLVLSVYEKDIAQLQLGQKVKVYSNENPSKIYWANIISIGKKINENRMLEVDCHIEGSKEGLVAGYYMNAEIVNATQKAWQVPSKAVLKFGEDHFIYVPIGKNQYKRLKVQILGEEHGYTYVDFIEKENLKPKEYVSDGAYHLLMVQENKEE